MSSQTTVKACWPVKIQHESRTPLIHFSQEKPRSSQERLEKVFNDLTEALHTSIQQDTSLPIGIRFQLQKQKVLVSLWRGLSKVVNSLVFNLPYVGLNPGYTITFKESLSRSLQTILMNLRELAHNDGYNGGNRPYLPKIEVLKNTQNQVLFKNPQTGKVISLEKMSVLFLKKKSTPNALNQLTSKHLNKIMTPENLDKVFQLISFTNITEESTAEKTVYQKIQLPLSA